MGYLVGGGSECLGGVYSVRNCTLVGGPAYSTALVRVSNAATGMRDSTLIAGNCNVTMGSCVIFATNDFGSTTYKGNAIIDGITFTDGATSMTQVLRMTGTGAGGDGDFIRVDNISNAPSGVFLYIAAGGYGSTVKCRLMNQQGSITVNTNSAATFNSGTATYRYSYGSKIPKITMSIDQRIVNTANPLGVAYRSKGGSACTFDVFTTNNANAGAVLAVTVDYVAGVTES